MADFDSSVRLWEKDKQSTLTKLRNGLPNCEKAIELIELNNMDVLKDDHDGTQFLRLLEFVKSSGASLQTQVIFCRKLTAYLPDDGREKIGATVVRISDAYLDTFK